MPYCAIADIEASEQDLIDLTDDNGDGVINQTVMDKAIATAGELVDGFLRGRESLPLDPVPGLLTALAADIALYRLYGRRPRLAIPDSLSDKYKNALKLLENIQKGQVILGAVQVGGEITPPAVSLVKASDRLFSDDKLSRFPC